MNKDDTDFDSWFDILKISVLERSGVEFRDRSAVRDDYDQGRDAFDVAEEIAQEYNA